MSETTAHTAKKQNSSVLETSNELDFITSTHCSTLSMKLNLSYFTCEISNQSVLKPVQWEVKKESEKMKSWEYKLWDTQLGGFWINSIKDQQHSTSYRAHSKIACLIHMRCWLGRRKVMPKNGEHERCDIIHKIFLHDDRVSVKSISRWSWAKLSSIARDSLWLV